MTDEELAQWLFNVHMNKDYDEGKVEWSNIPKTSQKRWLLTAREIQKKVHCQEICNYWHSLYEQELELNNALLGEAEELKSHFLKGEQDGK